jgi:hypothetical protein
VVLNAVTGYTAGQSPTPYMRLVVGPPWTRLTSPTNILKVTRTGDDIHTVNGLAVNRLGQGETSVRLVGGEDDMGEETLLTDFAGATRCLVKSSWGCWIVGGREGIASQDCR